MKKISVRLLTSTSCFLAVTLYGMGIPQEIQKDDKVAPIVLVHGLKNDHTSLNKTKAILEKNCPGTEVYTPDIGCFGFLPCEAQIKELTNYINSISDLKDGFNLIGYSLGGIIARGVVEQGNIPRAYSLITIASPHRGVCGFPGKWDDDFDALAKKTTGLEPLSEVERRAHLLQIPLDKIPVPVSSIVDLWHEPTQQSTYLKYNRFLPYFNNEKDHENFDAFKHNLSTAAAFICLAASRDDVVEPWQSARWDYFDKKRAKIVALEDSKLYQNLGLQDLGSAFKRITIEGATHGGIHEKESTIKQHILPYLTRESELEPDSGTIYEETNKPWWQCCICCK